jgi:hypothetical protein
LFRAFSSARTSSLFGDPIVWLSELFCDDIKQAILDLEAVKRAGLVITISGLVFNCIKLDRTQS